MFANHFAIFDVADWASDETSRIDLIFGRNDDVARTNAAHALSRYTKPAAESARYSSRGQL